MYVTLGMDQLFGNSFYIRWMDFVKDCDFELKYHIGKTNMR